jgi:hypothetical protein
MQPRRLRSSQIAGLPPFTTFHDTGGAHLRRRPPPECYSHKLKSLRYGDGGGVPPVDGGAPLDEPRCRPDLRSSFRV